MNDPGEELALIVVRRVLEQHAADALGDPATDLPFDDGRVDHLPAVLDDEVAWIVTTPVSGSTSTKQTWVVAAQPPPVSSGR